MAAQPAGVSTTPPSLVSFSLCRNFCLKDHQKELCKSRKFRRRPAPVLRTCCRVRVCTRLRSPPARGRVRGAGDWAAARASGAPAAREGLELCPFPGFCSCEVALKRGAKENVWVMGTCVVCRSGVLAPVQTEQVTGTWSSGGAGGDGGSPVSATSRDYGLRLHQGGFRLEIGKISLLREWSGVGPGCPGQWGSPHPWRGSDTVWLWHLGTGFSRVGVLR